MADSQAPSNLLSSELLLTSSVLQADVLQRLLALFPSTMPFFKIKDCTYARLALALSVDLSEFVGLASLCAFSGFSSGRSLSSSETCNLSEKTCSFENEENSKQ